MKIPKGVRKYHPHRRVPGCGRIVLIRVVDVGAAAVFKKWHYGFYDRRTWYRYYPDTGLAHPLDPGKEVESWCYAPPQVVDFFETWVGRCYQARVDCAAGVAGSE